jgi:alpha-1,2-mannosyltransferase
VINGSGDELYGIEPVSYYLKNLFLNLGIIFPLAMSCPLIALINKFLHVKESTTRIEYLDGHAMTIIISCFLWLAVLFIRPHKEERFMYPVYPFLCFAAALSSMYLVDSLSRIALFAFKLK